MLKTGKLKKKNDDKSYLIGNIRLIISIKRGPSQQIEIYVISIDIRTTTKVTNLHQLAIY